MKKLKIGLFIDDFYPTIDGVIIVVDNLATILSKKYDVVVVAPEGDYDDSLKPYKVIRVDGLKIPKSDYVYVSKKSNYSKIYKELLEEKFDIINIHSPFNIGKLGVSLAKNLNIPCIGTVHTRYDFEVNRIVKNKLITKIVMKTLMNTFNGCNKCIVVNELLSKEIKAFGYKGETIVINNGTDMEKYNNKELLNELLDKYNIKENDNVLIFVGRLIDIKNIYFIADVLKKLDEKKFNFKMLFVGEGQNEKELKEMIKDYKLNDKTIFTGRIDDRNLLSAHYAISDLLLFPSLMDTSSLVRIEAAVNEVPGLYIDESMVANTITKDYNGYISKLDVDEYANKIIDIFNNKNYLKKIGKNASKSLVTKWEQIVEDLYIEEINKNI